MVLLEEEEERERDLALSGHEHIVRWLSVSLDENSHQECIC